MARKILVRTIVTYDSERPYVPPLPAKGQRHRLQHGESISERWVSVLDDSQAPPNKRRLKNAEFRRQRGHTRTRRPHGRPRNV